MKIFRNLLFYPLMFAIFSFLLGTDSLFSIETSAFFHENLLGSQSSSSENEFYIYQNSSAGFSMKYPSEWQIQELESKNIMFRPMERGVGLVVELSPIDLPPIYAEGRGLEILLAEGKKLVIEKYSNEKNLVLDYLNQI